MTVWIEIFRIILAIGMVAGTLIYFLAAIFAPFGIVWLVLAH
jgi:hypothetical protein